MNKLKQNFLYIVFCIAFVYIVLSLRVIVDLKTQLNIFQTQYNELFYKCEKVNDFINDMATNNIR